MKRLTHSGPSSFGREVTVRFGSREAEALFAHMRQDSRREQMAFGLASRSKTAQGTLLIVNQLLLPDKSDLSQQTAGGVCPTSQFQSYVYFGSLQRGEAIVEFHTHPGGCTPRFSGIDDTHANLNAQYIRRKLPDPITLAMVVGNNKFDLFDGVIYDRCLEGFRPLDRLEVLSRPTRCWSLGDATGVTQQGEKDEFDRQTRILGWNQEGLERQRIALGGLGGNGAQVLQTVVGIGAGCRGSLTLIDPDVVEGSNLPRIPYASREQVGTPKVTAAAQYVGRRSPETPVFAFPCAVSEKVVVDRIKMSTVIIGCGDNDGLRKQLNELAVRYLVPYIDLGCDIQVEGDNVIAGGQVRVVIPGVTGCLVCCGGFDPSQAALDQMDDVARAHNAARGYVQGSSELAAPSVANLNGLTAQFAVSQLLALVNGEHFSPWEYLHIDQISGRTIPARSQANETCPVCGVGGVLGAGDPLEHARNQPAKLRQLKPETETDE